jgi:hypothetical protein
MGRNTNRNLAARRRNQKRRKQVARLAKVEKKSAKKAK